jgi:hypothetical protein
MELGIGERLSDSYFPADFRGKATTAALAHAGGVA